MKQAFVWGIGTGLGVVVYVALVAQFMANAENWFGQVAEPWGIMLVLLLLVFSAAVIGTMVFGRPAFVALQGDRNGALRTLAVTLGTIIILGIILVFIVFTL